jgi:hypothetical protein
MIAEKQSLKGLVEKYHSVVQSTLTFDMVPIAMNWLNSSSSSSSSSSSGP